MSENTFFNGVVKFFNIFVIKITVLFRGHLIFGECEETFIFRGHSIYGECQERHY